MSVESSRAGHLAPGGALNMTGGSRTPSYVSDTLSRETIQFQDLHIFQQQQPYPSPHHPLQDSLQRQTNRNSGAILGHHSQHQKGSSAAGSTRATSPSMNSHFSEHQQVEFQFIEKIQLDQQCVTLIKEMRTVLQLSDDFERDVEKERESSRDLLCELQRKIRPFLVQLDEKAVAQEEVIKQQVDKCVVTDPRLNWLLKYNNFTQDFRKIIKKLIEDIYDNLEQILNLKTRGCDGINSRTDKLKGKIQSLVQMLDRLDCEVRIEMDKSESSYEQELRS